MQNAREERVRKENSEFSHPSPPSDISPPNPSGRSQLITNSVRGKIFKYLFARASHRYGFDSRTVKHAKKSPIGRDRKILLYKECSSHTHLIKECSRAKKPSLIAFAMDLRTDAYNLPPNDLFDIIQDLPDSVWYILPLEIHISNLTISRNLLLIMQMLLKMTPLINHLKLCIPGFPHGPRSISSVGNLFRS